MKYEGSRSIWNGTQFTPFQFIKYLQVVMASLLVGLVLFGGPVPLAHAGPSYTVSNTNDSGTGSLRQAILSANAYPGTDTIAFNIPGTGPHTIQPLSQLPTITDPVIIDGYTQPDASPNTNGPGLGNNAVLMIELDASLAGTVPTLHITSGNSTIRGLAINRSLGYSIYITGNGGNVVEGCFIGTDITGAFVLSGGPNGVRILNSNNNKIGGISPEARNILSGNGYGAVVGGSSSTGNLIQGNLIGTDITGTIDLGNRLDGVAVSGVNNTVGGTTPAARNIISGNGRKGINVSYGSGILVQGNFIGTDITGKLPIGNSQCGMIIFRGSGNTIGGSNPAAGNIISHSRYSGIGILDSGTGNLVLGNSIFSNGGLGIDLAGNVFCGDGITPNDIGDPDSGSNDLQNFPVLTSAGSGGPTIIEGTLNSTVSSTFRLEFFSNSIPDPSGYGEGETFLGFSEVSTDSTGNVTFKVVLPFTVIAGQHRTATATDANGNTSEFSQSIPVVPIAVPQVALDIKPQSDPNSINLGSQGLISVAIITDSSFDATTVDPASVEFASAYPTRWVIEDINKDKVEDLLFHFDTQELNLNINCSEAMLIGETFGGQLIFGVDDVNIVSD